MKLSLMDAIKIAGFLVALTMCFLTWKASYDAFNTGQTALAVELKGIHVGLEDMGKRMDRIEGIVYATPGRK